METRLAVLSYGRWWASSSPPFQVVKAGLTAAVLLLVADLRRGSALWSCCSDAVEGTVEEEVAEGGRPWLVSRRLENNQDREGAVRFVVERGEGRWAVQGGRVCSLTRRGRKWEWPIAVVAVAAVEGDGSTVARWLRGWLSG
uniref:Uncharacterized protein n=1 Tax=Populus alba TaxID=43335 RepID=A0A4U5NSZ3_POPAL|nr:hypothetical protein D5086_0000240040 [Populus alba]